MLGYAKKFACVLVVGQPRHGLDMFFFVHLDSFVSSIYGLWLLELCDSFSCEHGQSYFSGFELMFAPACMM